MIPPPGAVMQLINASRKETLRHIYYIRICVTVAVKCLSAQALTRRPRQVSPSARMGRARGRPLRGLVLGLTRACARLAARSPTRAFLTSGRWAVWPV